FSNLHIKKLAAIYNRKAYILLFYTNLLVSNKKMAFYTQKNDWVNGMIDTIDFKDFSHLLF
ncbi:MAG: hypothetical protein WCG93_16945, partial [Paludibacter sp.]